MAGVIARLAEAGPMVRSDTADFDAWMAAEQRRVFQLCYRLLGERDEADAATQDVFLKAFRALQRPGAIDPDRPAAWLTRVAVNCCLDRLRSRRWQFWRRRLKGEDEKAVLLAARDRSAGPEQQVFARQIATRLLAAVGALSERQRSVFVLRHYEDSSLEDIAATLGLDVGTVKTHLSRALTKLRTELRDLYRPAGGRE